MQYNTSLKCHSKLELAKYHEIVIFRNNPDIFCTKIEISCVENIFERARVYLIKYNEISLLGNIGIYAGMLTLGIGSIMAIAKANIKINNLKKHHGFDDPNSEITKIARLYQYGYRITDKCDSQNFTLKNKARHEPGNLL